MSFDQYFPISPTPQLLETTILFFISMSFYESGNLLSVRNFFLRGESQIYSEVLHLGHLYQWRNFGEKLILKENPFVGFLVGSPRGWAG